MGSWSLDPFDHDTAREWALDLERVDDVELIEDTLTQFEAAVDAASESYASADLVAETLAACEALARLRTPETPADADTPDTVRAWLDRVDHVPAEALLRRATEAVDTIRDELGDHAAGWHPTRQVRKQLTKLSKRVQP